jgi:hypothetical protein
MGLDIQLCSDVDQEIYKDASYIDPVNGFHRKYSLSRTFCNLMCRQHNVQMPELDQIGRITNIDISPFYEMEQYQTEDDEGLQASLEMAETEEERQLLLDNARKMRESMKGNIDAIHTLVSALIGKLSAIKNLPALLDDGENDLLDYKKYFTHFDIDKGDGYIDNNFGHDLRNFKRFLEFVKGKGASTVYFSYG